jgi:hypothetical protein
LDRHSQALIDHAHNRTQTAHCFALIRDVLRLVAEECADAISVLKVFHDLNDLLFELRME